MAAITIYSDFGAPPQKSLTVFAVGAVADFFGGGAPKSLQMVIAVMKLKDTYSVEGKL